MSRRTGCWEWIVNGSIVELGAESKHKEFYYKTRNTSAAFPQLPSVRTNYGKFTFAYSAAKAWNSFPECVLLTRPKDAFKASANNFLKKGVLKLCHIHSKWTGVTLGSVWLCVLCCSFSPLFCSRIYHSACHTSICVYQLRYVLSKINLHVNYKISQIT